MLSAAVMIRVNVVISLKMSACTVKNIIECIGLVKEHLMTILGTFFSYFSIKTYMLKRF